MSTIPDVLQPLVEQATERAALDNYQKRVELVDRLGHLREQQAEDDQPYAAAVGAAEAEHGKAVSALNAASAALRIARRERRATWQNHEDHAFGTEQALSKTVPAEISEAERTLRHLPKVDISRTETRDGFGRRKSRSNVVALRERNAAIQAARQRLEEMKREAIEPVELRVEIAGLFKSIPDGTRVELVK